MFSRKARWVFLAIHILWANIGQSIQEDNQPAHREEVDSTGIIFNKIKTVILADTHEFASFLLPFPSFNQTFGTDILNATKIIAEYWNVIPGDCPELRQRVVPDTQAQDLLKVAMDTQSKAQSELQHMKEDLAKILQPPDHQERHRRFAGVLTAAAAGAGLLALGTVLHDGCIAGVLGPCPDKKHIAENREAINEAIDQLNARQKQWTTLTKDLDERFFIVAGEIENIRHTQEDFQQQQREFWNATTHTLQGITSQVKSMTVCTEFLFTRSQINLLRTTVASRIQLIQSTLQSFRVALWSYRATLLAAIPGLANGLLPMSLVSRDTLLAILKRIHASQANNNQHLTLALPLDSILRYYETPLVQRVETTDNGLLITLGIPLTTRETIMNIYEAIPLPMPSNDTETATQWKPETNYIAVSLNRKEHALLHEHHLTSCVGPNDAAVCKHGFATTRNRDSCLATLFYHTPAAAISTCEIDTITLPRVETAQNLGYGRWLITRSNPNYNFEILPSGHGQIPTMETTGLTPGCTVCIITLACGTELTTDTLFLKADATSCSATGARRLSLTLSTPLADLFSYIPLNATRSTQEILQARRQLYKQVQIHLPLPQDNIGLLSSSRLREIAEPLARAYQAPPILHKLPHITSRNTALELTYVALTALVVAIIVQLAYLGLQRGMVKYKRSKRREPADARYPPLLQQTSNTSQNTPSAPPPPINTLPPASTTIHIPQDIPDQQSRLTALERLAIIRANVGGIRALPAAPQQPPAYSRSAGHRV